MKKGEVIWLKHITNKDGYKTDLSGAYEIISKGKTYHLFCNNKGVDLFLTKKEILEKISFLNPCE